MSETIEYDGATIAWGPAPDAPMTALRGLYYEKDSGYPGDDDPIAAGFLAFWKDGVTGLLDYHGTEDRFNTSIITDWTLLAADGYPPREGSPATGAAVGVREWVEGYGYGSVIVGFGAEWEDVEGIEMDEKLLGKAPRNDAGWRNAVRASIEAGKAAVLRDDEFIRNPEKGVDF